jgi:hypothetical protein
MCTGQRIPYLLGSSTKALPDEERDALMRLARPLDPAMRDAFLRAIATELARCQPEALGPGLVSRIGGENTFRAKAEVIALIDEVCL